MLSKYFFILYGASFIFVGTTIAQVVPSMKCMECIPGANSSLPVICRIKECLSGGVPQPPSQPPVIVRNSFNIPVGRGTTGGSASVPALSTGNLKHPSAPQRPICLLIHEKSCENSFNKQFCRWIPAKAGICGGEKMGVDSIFMDHIRTKIAVRRNVPASFIKDIRIASMPAINCKADNAPMCWEKKGNITILLVYFKMGLTPFDFAESNITVPFRCVWSDGESGRCVHKS